VTLWQKKLCVLDYGAGVLGSYLAHRLHRCGINVTLLAHGAWKETIDKDILIMRSYRLSVRFP